MNAPLRLYVIRHGQTAWSESGQHTSLTDVPLTTEGEAQARLLLPWLRDVAFVQVQSSPARRALQTCALAGSGTEPRIDPELAEWNYGDYEGQRSDDIRRERPGWSVWRDGCPHGETPAQVGARADRVLARLRLLRGNIALFTHGQFGAALGVRWIGLPLVNGQHFPLRPASINILGDEPGHAGIAAILLWNALPAGA
jgi:probable phosphoglycerate mutase